MRETTKVFAGGKELKGVVSLRMNTSAGVVGFTTAPKSPTGSDDLIVDKDALWDHMRSLYPSPEQLEGI